MPDPWRCPNCGLLNWPPATYCPRCGTDDRTQLITGPRRRATPVALVLILAALICGAIWQGLRALSEAEPPPAPATIEGSRPHLPPAPEKVPPPPVSRLKSLPPRVRVTWKWKGPSYYQPGDVMRVTEFEPAEAWRLLRDGRLEPVSEDLPLTFGD